ncbi:hypothetical protein AB9P05_21585 [Roseivirga sp. BDSF3-8]|uniref:hypothetical protein n=1 Tax=Roseivirga sp. BDSF3-8 TaxID=3241598 RepID=UPI0035328025
MEEIKNISFSKKPIPLPADYRPMYKIAQIVLILKSVCRGNTAKLIKLHLFSWALKSQNNREELMNLISSNFESDFSVWGIEPSLNRAVHFAVAEKICEYSKGSYKLTKKGENFYKIIEADAEILKIEKEFLAQIGKSKVTDSKLLEITSKWTLFNDKN